MGKHASLIVGLMLLVGTLIYVRFLGLRTSFEYVIVRTVFALAAGYAAAGLLGTFELQNRLLKASGGFGVAALLFLVNPVGTLAVASAAPEKKQGIETVDSLLSQPESPEQPLAPAVDSISKAMGYSDYQQFRVLASPQATRELQASAVRYATLKPAYVRPVAPSGQ